VRKPVSSFWGPFTMSITRFTAPPDRRSVDRGLGFRDGTDQADL